VLETPYQIENGTLMPRGPGLGISWNECEIRNALV
jgi:hypothetical protein